MFEHKAGTFKPRELDANSLIADVAATFRLKAETSGGTIETELNAEVANVYVDEMHFTNVIFNLMDNALKYKKPDESSRILVTTRNEADKLIISVQDNGIGIKKEDLKKIFDRFFRVHTGNRHDVKGFGLGLAYVKKIIMFHKGQIYAESELGKGTTFIITLPIIKQ
jgi:signal transduction histidine kinase